MIVAPGDRCSCLNPLYIAEVVLTQSGASTPAFSAPSLNPLYIAEVVLTIRKLGGKTTAVIDGLNPLYIAEVVLTGN